MRYVISYMCYSLFFPLCLPHCSPLFLPPPLLLVPFPLSPNVLLLSFHMSSIALSSLLPIL